jgi:hypothetical protein
MNGRSHGQARAKLPVLRFSRTVGDRIVFHFSADGFQNTRGPAAYQTRGAVHPGFNNAQSDRDFRNIDRVMDSTRSCRSQTRMKAMKKGRYRSFQRAALGVTPASRRKCLAK